ncbi:M20 family metallopeptidase [Cytobacillus oceanisediminis]|uniref:M20 family metallopeptidase n=1 Tax=Cytobacillus TaxID=2675230 RepID=UPI00204144C8|nr:MULTISPECIES: M20 family metallopeptidase [Cytobacillus]MBY0158754.1 M20 family metallopeptidase [Cytobacillus firmus]MCM3395199.1 M20 family metallopeptidase [Cytobacillus oceanisediminis]MCM3529177.1 M20 family metallopeptidase [Cytobacillus oceanisediminis]UQX56839.1 M20 family metallopeptidase [Cytobacillus pseudoceanisediminis]
MAAPVKALSELKEAIKKNVEGNKELYLSASHRIHATPEIGNEEFFASGLLSGILEKEGFEVERAVAGHETAFLARKKSDKPGPSIAFLAEYDALPGLGHGCGHNIIGTTSVAAAIALSKVIDETGGEAVVFGTPAEEGGPNGSAKGSFVKHGLLEGIDAALMVHPSNHTRLTSSSLAVDPLDFEFIGKPAHAAASPEEGINALDAVIQLFNGINALRQQLKDDVRIHGIITHGGDAPNIIPEYAKARFFIRATTRTSLNEVTRKVKAVAEGAALATGAKLNVIAFQNEVDNLLLNKTYDQVFKEVIEDLGETVVEGDRDGIGSTDAGNISQVVPTIHPYIKIGADDLVAHTVPFREAAASVKGDEALITGAKGLALTAFQLVTDQELLKSIKQEFLERKAAE